SPAPRYHARDVAIVRAQRLGATVILGSATPSLESHHNAARRKFHRLVLSRRIGTAELPRVEVIDMARETADAAEPSPLSRPLRDALAARLERGEQSIVLLNRRGFAAFVRCAGCGKVLRCDHCDVAQTWHRRRGLLVCHWCESARRMPPACPECESENLIPVGLGTQRIEEVLAAEFPDARLRRIDLDTTRGKDAFLVHWREISEGRVDIILGTQMIAKGLDLPRVTLVGVISADQTLFLPDFRASERAFQLLTQVAGRAGRADLPGEVLIQTFVPHHWAIRCAIEHDFEAFFAKEMKMRRLLRFPPAQRMASMLFSGEQEASVSAAAKRMGEICDTIRHLDEMRETLTTVGPAPAPIARLSDRWRWRLLLRSSSARALHRALALAGEEYSRRSPPRGVQLTIDVDPMDLL
ncbi:primosomal protein N', partial [Candidatus Sumerlaeota bacterium]|nr:primosomal protein N' [Candidatus Sumerlaeota bacterium]